MGGGGVVQPDKHKKTNNIFIAQNLFYRVVQLLDWLQSLKQFFIKVSYHILVASLTMMALLQQSHQS